MSYAIHRFNRIYVLLVVLIVILSSGLKVYSLNVYKCVNEGSNKIALTFDDGPHPIQTSKILDLLNKHEIKATFFVIGKNVDNYTEQLKMVVENGHELGNHTDSHIILENEDENKIRKELDECERKVLNATGYEMKILRPPCGKYDQNVLSVADEKNYKTILWNIDTNDWAHNSANKIVQNVIKNVRGGDIILFHDYVSGANSTIDSLQIIIPELKKRGFEFVTVSELISEHDI